MNDRDVFAFDLEHDDVAGLDRLLVHPQEQQVAAIERRLHRLTAARSVLVLSLSLSQSRSLRARRAPEHDDDRALRASDERERLPDGERRAEYQQEAEHLHGLLSPAQRRDRTQHA